MSDQEPLSGPATPPAVPPPSRVGNFLGWGLLALGIACFIACIWATVNADSAQYAWDAALASPVHSIPAYSAIAAARVAYHDATLRANLLSIAACLTLLAFPGLLYATRPSLLGGPVGRFLRTASAKWAPQHSRRKHPITYYQGLSLLLFGTGWAIFWLGPIVTTFTPVGSAGVWPVLLNALTGLLTFLATFMSFPLMGGSWWFATGGQDPGADVGDHGLEVAPGDG